MVFRSLFRYGGDGAIPSVPFELALDHIDHGDTKTRHLLAAEFHITDAISCAAAYHGVMHGPRDLCRPAVGPSRDPIESRAAPGY